MKVRLIIALLTVVTTVTAQNVSVSATLEPAQLQIGEQAVLRFTVAQPQDKSVVLPLLSDTITHGVEIVEIGKPDTVSLDNNRIQIDQDYLITSFDSGFYFVPAYAFVCDADTIYTQPLGLSVHTVAVNPETDDIKTIKPIMSAPFLWSEVLTWASYALLGLIVIALIVFVLLKYVFKKKVPFITTAPEPVIPPHVVALNRLETIKNEKMWQTGQIKDFYTELTDVLRVYMDGQFGINAMELTSDEIMALVKKEPQMDAVRQQLQELLTLSDLVKFAKMIPLENENERSLLWAFTIVETTKPQEETEVESQKSVRDN